MTKQDIANYVVSNTTLSRSQAQHAAESIIEAIGSSLANGESVFLRGFGTFKVVTTKEKKARNISKGTTVIVPAGKAVKFIAGKELKAKMR